MDAGQDVLTKAEAMDKHMEAYEPDITSSAIFAIIHRLYNLDIEAVPELSTSPRLAMDTFLSACEEKPTGSEVRRAINQALGINLDALSALDGAKFSLFSKGQWMLQNDKDIFVIHTGTGDVDVKITTTPYYAEQAGTTRLPMPLIQELELLGYTYEEESGGYYYVDPAGAAVSDAFKGRTIMAVRQVIQQSYSHL